MVTGSVSENATIVAAAATRPQRGPTTVHTETARVAQHRAATSAWTAR
jgi:hypothetical protein